jgi:hypothetical protein
MQKGLTKVPAKRGRKKKVELLPVATKTTGKKTHLNKKDIISRLVELKIKEKCSQTTLLKILMEPPYNYKQTRAYQLLAEASDFIGEVQKNWAVNALEEALADLSQQKEEAKSNNDRKMVLEITKEENKLKGLYIEKQLIKQELNITFDFGINDETEETI